MPVEYDQASGLINLHNNQISYIIQILDDRYPVHRYFGRYLPNTTQLAPLPSGNHAFAVDLTDDFPYSVTSLPLEYSTISSGDYRQPAYLINDEQHQLLPLLEFTGLSISDQPLNPEQLPPTVSANTPVTTLILHLTDSVTGLDLDLNYTIFENESVILRSTTLRNHGTANLTLNAMASAQLDLLSDQYSALTFQGTHAHEANSTLVPLHAGIQSQRSLRGTSGPQQQPFTALAAPDTTELTGEVLSCALVWSGNFDSTIEVDQYQHTRLTIGLEPTTFEWQLTPGDNFQTPEVILTWSASGFNGMSQVLHAFGNQLQPELANVPSAINTWETMQFDVSATKVSQLTEHAHQLGIKMVVIDDGWFTNRHGENGQLGDWIPDQTKFPAGLEPLSLQAHDLHMKFGLWVEPEMITMNSQLYQQHPDWVLQYQGRQPITARHQLVLDLSQSVVRQHLLTVLTRLVQDNHLDYLKWDMNRHLTQVGSPHLPATQQGEVYYRYVLGLYDLLAQLRVACPDLIIENCSAGGGRLDFGLLAYTNQTWISDLTDPIDRAVIENGFSYLFSPRVFSNHLTASPNAQNGRVTSLKTRLQFASIGQLGFELNLSQLQPAEQVSVKQWLAQYQALKPDFMDAHFYRLPTSTLAIAWLLVTPDRQQALLYYSYGLGSAVKTTTTLPLHYLDPDTIYTSSTEIQVDGMSLNTVGWTITPANQDFTSQLIYLHAVD